MIQFSDFLTEMNDNRLYRIWANMKKRVNNPTGSHRHYKGLDYHDRWEDFDTFEKWSLGNGYEEDLELDREDVTKGYAPSNCRWVSKEVQQRNKGVMSNNTSGHRGVHPHRDKWRATTKKDGKSVHIGIFDTKEEASMAFEKFTSGHIKNLVGSTHP